MVDAEGAAMLDESGKPIEAPGGTIIHAAPAEGETAP
jgi:hypothetical protein